MRIFSRFTAWCSVRLYSLGKTLDVDGVDGGFVVAVAGTNEHGECDFGHVVGSAEDIGERIEKDEYVLYCLDVFLPFCPAHECGTIGKGVPEAHCLCLLLGATLHLLPVLFAVGGCTCTAQVDKRHLAFVGHNIGEMHGYVIRNAVINIAGVPIEVTPSPT